MDLVAQASVAINASAEVVWGVLLSPATIPRLMPVSEVVAGFRLGEVFIWTFELGGSASRVEGRVLRLESERVLEYTYIDPHSSSVLGINNVHRVRIELSPEADGTRVTVTQDGNLSEAAQTHAEGGWRLALRNLQHLVEVG